MAQVIYIGAPEAEAAQFAARARVDFPGIDLYASNDRATTLTAAGDAEALIGHHFQFDNDLVGAAPRLRWIQSLTSGTDAILKLSSLPVGVVVTSTRGMHGPQMSELVFLQMLALTRDFPRMLRNQQTRCWERWPQSLLLDKTVLVVGVGAISETLAPRCKAFGMTVYGVSHSDRLPPGFDKVFARSQLRDAVSLADYLVLLVPLSRATQNLIDAQVLAAMKSSAYLINVARGGVLDESALATALREGRIAGAALDVFQQTPLPEDHPLWSEERLIITPLLGGMSDVYLDQAYPIVRQNLTYFLADRLQQMMNQVERAVPA